jgi:hypothetical protein
MNFSTWFWLEWFQSLPITGKVAIIAAHILVLLLLMLYAITTSKRGDTNKALMVATYSKPAVKFVQTIGTSRKKGKLYNANKKVGHLLNMFCNKSLVKHLFYYQPCNEGDSPTYDIRWHIGCIVNRLKSRCQPKWKRTEVSSQ